MVGALEDEALGMIRVDPVKVERGTAAPTNPLVAGPFIRRFGSPLADDIRPQVLPRR